MNYINKLTKQLGGGQLSELEHFVAYDAEANMVHVAPKQNFIIVTTNQSGVKMYKYNETGGTETIRLEQGENKIKNIDYGWKCFYTTAPRITSFDLTNYDTSQVTNMFQMFTNCSDLTSLDVSSFNTSKVTTMRHMFSDCNKLTSLDLSSFDTSKVTSMSNMFQSCTSLTSLDLSSFKTSKVIIMNSMFADCGITALDLKNWDTSQLTHLSYMFYGCSSLTSLDLSSFDTSKVTSMSHMFEGCTSLTHIKCKQVFKDWCITNKTTIELPTAMENGTVGGIGSGSNWEIIDYV